MERVTRGGGYEWGTGEGEREREEERRKGERERGKRREGKVRGKWVLVRRGCDSEVRESMTGRGRE